MAAIDPAVRQYLRPIYSPLIEIIPTGAQVVLQGFDAVIFTSAYGVRFAPKGRGKAAYCVGDETAKAASDAGWAAKVAGQNAAQLIRQLAQDAPQRRLLHLSGVHTRGDIARSLSRLGTTTVNQAVYDQKLVDLTTEAAQILVRENHVLVPLFSSRTAAQFAKHSIGKSTIDVIALSAAVSEPLANLSLGGLTIADEPDKRSMVRAIEKLVQNIALG